MAGSYVHSPRRISEAFDNMREYIETQIISTVHERFDPVVLKKILDGNQVGSGGAPTLIDDSLHTVLCRAKQ